MNTIVVALKNFQSLLILFFILFYFLPVSCPIQKFFSLVQISAKLALIKLRFTEIFSKLKLNVICLLLFSTNFCLNSKIFIDFFNLL